MVKAYISGQMEDATMVNGNLTKCMEKVSSPGLMVKSMKVITLMIKKKDKELLPGLMEEATMVVGKTEGSMDMENTYHLREKLKKENG